MICRTIKHSYRVKFESVLLRSKENNSKVKGNIFEQAEIVFDDQVHN